MKTFLKITAFSAVLLMLAGIAISCNEQEQNNFCSYFENIRSVPKTIPVINSFLNGLPGSLNERQKKEELGEWLALCPHVISAWPHSIYPEPNIEFRVSIKDYRGIRDQIPLALKFSETNPLQATHWLGLFPIPKILMETRLHFSIDSVFDFINSLSLNTAGIDGSRYFLDLPLDSLQFVLDYLNTKPYIESSNGHYVEFLGKINIQVSLVNMTNKNYQADWLKTINKFGFTYLDDVIGALYTVVIEVPKGAEDEWIRRLNEYGFVNWGTQLQQWRTL